MIGLFDFENFSFSSKNGFTSSNGFYFLVISILYAINIILFVYLMAMIFSNPGNGFTVVFIMVYVMSIVMVGIVQALRFINIDQRIATGFEYLFNIFPSFTFSFGVFRATCVILYEFKMDWFKTDYSIWDYKVAGREILFMFLHFLWINLGLIFME